MNVKLHKAPEVAESVAIGKDRANVVPGNAPTTVPFRLPGEVDFETYDSSKPDTKRKLTDHLLTSLQMQHLLVLCGSGTSLGAGGPSMGDLWSLAVGDPDQSRSAEVLELVGYRPQVGFENIEELLSRCDAFLQLDDDPLVSEFRLKTIEIILTECRKAGDTEESLIAHKAFLRRLARRRGRDSRLKLFTTNYDCCFERAASALGLVPLDGFSFGQPRRFDARHFGYDIVERSENSDTSAFLPGVFQYFKLHGSVNWSILNGRIEEAPAPSAEDCCLVYPARAKYQLAFQQPHVELMAQYLSALRQPNTCLLVAGFGFNDDHLSEPLLAAMESNPHLRVIIADPSVQKRLS